MQSQILFSLQLVWYWNFLSTTGLSVFTHDPNDSTVAGQIVSEVQQSIKNHHEEMQELRRLEFSTSAFDKAPLHGSPPPFFEEVVRRYGPPGRQHRQEYANHPHSSARRLASLSVNNTAPIRFAFNFDTLNETLVQSDPFLKDRYCFRAGDWYRVGYPTSSKPTGPGPDNCNRTSMGMAINAKNLWCVCTSSDEITPALVNLVKQATADVSKMLSAYFSVRPVQGKLKFTNSEGTYPAMWANTGQTGARCDADCVKGYKIFVPDWLCSIGTVADVLLSLTIQPEIAGIGGTGAFCSSDQNGRPLHLVFNWIYRPDAALIANMRAKAVLQQYNQMVTLIKHEVLHGLGFGPSMWLNSFISSGQRRQIIAQKPVYDKSGQKDVVYFFVPGTRASDVAKAYFGCDDDSQWQGLPLMGWPAFGRDSHHETRTMRDDLMSYGDGDSISSITLAALEDTGHYLANYSNADCIYWGQGRGCKFVTSRCEVRETVATANTSDVNDCSRSWSETYSPSNSEALRLCAKPQCKTLPCQKECYTGKLGGSCRNVPKGDIVAAGESNWVSSLQGQVEAYATSLAAVSDLAWILALPISLCCWYCFICCQPRSPTKFQSRVKKVFFFLNGIVFLSGALIVAGGGYLLFNIQLIQAYTSPVVVQGGIVLGSGIVLLSLFAALAVYKHSRCLTLIALLFSILGFLGLVAAVSFISVFARNADGLSSHSLAASGQASIAQSNPVYPYIESYICRTYQMCCTPTEVFEIIVANNGSAQCKASHEGIREGGDFILSDPSNPKFCPTITGVSDDLGASKGICQLLQDNSDTFKLDKCKADYCSSALQGYQNFLLICVDVYRKNLRILSLITGSAISFLLLLACALFSIWKTAPRSSAKKDSTANKHAVVPSHPEDNSASKPTRVAAPSNKKNSRVTPHT